MTNEPKRTPDGNNADQWERLSSELRAYKESQRRTWGALDDTTLGRYLAGELSEQETANVEQELHDRPELRKLTMLVRDVLGEFEPIAMEPSAPVPSEPPRLISFEKTRTRRRGVISFLRRRSSLVAAACLLFVLGMAMPSPNRLTPPTESLNAVALEADFAARGVMLEEIDPPVVAMGMPSDPDAAIPAALPPRQTSGGARGYVGAQRPRVHSSPALRPETLTPGRSVAVRGPVPRGKARKPGFRDEDRLESLVALQREANELREKGDLVAAEEKLSRFHELCKERLGEEHQATQGSARMLADLYAVLLRETPPAATISSAATQSGLATMAATDTSTPHLPEGPSVLSTPHVLETLPATQLDHLPVGEIKRHVVPVLASAVQSTPSHEKRLAYLQALGQLGPVSRGAVSVLAGRLEQTTDSAEVAEIVHVLQRLGPAAQPALPVLVRLHEQANGQCNLDETQRSRIHRLAMQLKRNEGQIGVRDEAGCFTFGVVRRSCNQLSQLAQSRGVEVFVETKSTPRDNPAQVLQHMGPRAVYLSINPERSAVEVRLSPQLQKEGFDAEKLRRQLLASFKNRKYDEVLLDSVQTIQAKAERLKK